MIEGIENTIKKLREVRKDQERCIWKELHAKANNIRRTYFMKKYFQEKNHFKTKSACDKCDGYKTHKDCYYPKWKMNQITTDKTNYTT